MSTGKFLNNMTIEQLLEVSSVFGDSTDSYVYIWDFVEDIFYCSNDMVEDFPLDSAAVHDFSQHIEKFVFSDDVELIKQSLGMVTSGEASFHILEYRWINRKNEPVWIECRGKVVITSDGHKVLVGRIAETGKKPKADALTGLRRDVSFKNNITSILKNKPQSIQYIMRIDIDNFKEINEHDGTLVGDNVLKEFAGCLVNCVKSKVDLYRLTADEFMIVDCVSDESQDPEAIFDAIRHEVRRLVKEKEYKGFFTISAGVMVSGFEGKNADDIMTLTEFALNEAKMNGKNQLVFFDQFSYDNYVKKLNIRRELRKAVAAGCEGFMVYYQPIVDANTFELVGAEALLRFQNESLGFVSPGIMIPLLEDSGLIIPVGRYVLEQAAKASKIWRKHIPTFHINVNISYVQILKSNIMLDVRRVLEEFELEPEALCLELTESGFIESDSRIIELFSTLKEHNIDLAIDDFGTGYSNIRYLDQIAAKTVKIDRSFMLQAMKNDYDYLVVSHIVDMVHSIGANICIEGIEHTEELEKMRLTNPDLIQGFLFGRPSSMEEFERNFIESYKE